MNRRDFIKLCGFVPAAIYVGSTGRVIDPIPTSFGGGELAAYGKARTWWFQNLKPDGSYSNDEPKHAAVWNAQDGWRPTTNKPLGIRLEGVYALGLTAEELSHTHVAVMVEAAMPTLMFITTVGNAG